MSFARETNDKDLDRRLAEIESRLQFLEDILLEDAEEALSAPRAVLEAATAYQDDATTAPAFATALSGSAPAPDLPSEPEPSSEPKDLRRLQAEATAGFSYTRPEPPPEPRSPFGDLRDIEERLAGRALALVGGTALLLGAVFFLSLAFSRGWIGPQMQVALGLTGGALGLAVGAFLLFRAEVIVGHVLTAVGLAVISLSLFAATELYDLAEPPVALLGVFLAAAVTTFVAVRSRSQVVAGFGLVAALAAPPLMGAAPDLLTMAYMAVALVGIAAVSLWQTWPWLPPVAYLLSAPQLYQWILTEPDPAQAIPAILGYWAVLAVVAGGEAFRSPRPVLSMTSAPLFLLVGATAIGLGFSVLPADPERAAFLLTLAALHGLIAAFFAARRGSLDPFGLLAGAFGIGIASAAVPLLLDAPATAVVWTAEAGTLAFFAGRRAHGPALMASMTLFTIASVGLTREALLDSPLYTLLAGASVSGSTDGFVAGFVFLVAAAVVAILAVPLRSYRLFVIGLVAVVAVPVTALLLDGAAIVTVWMLIAVAAVGVIGWIGYLPERRIRWQLGPALRWIRPTWSMIPYASIIPKFAAAVATVLAFAETVLLVIDQHRLPAVPFTDQAGLATLALAGGFTALGVVAGRATGLRRGLFAAGSVIGIVSITEIVAPWYVLVWSGLAIGAAAMSRAGDGGILSYRRMSFGALAVLAALALVEAPPTRLMVGAGGMPSQPLLAGSGGVPPHPLLVSDATLALGVLALALAAVAYIGRGCWTRGAIEGLATLAGGTVLYLLSVGTVDVFAGEAYGIRFTPGGRLDELIKEAQVALSILWTAVGVLVLGAGLLLRQAELRLAGLAVLGLATFKVFLVDLSSLDIAYRVITLIVLGLLLIASAYAWSRMKPGDPGAHGRRNDPPDTAAPADAAVRDVHARP
jgi:uncharacterized membrane protein